MNLFKSKKDEKKTERERVEERREEVLAQGRKFKYPLQYTKHRVVINTILISLVVIAFAVLTGWLALFKFQMTDELLYRVTTIIPVSVAKVDNEKVRFSDYLLLYRSGISVVEKQSDSAGNDEGIKKQYKRNALTNAEKYAYALKIAKENNIIVSNEEIDREFERHRKVGAVDRSTESFLKILDDNFGISKTEYRRMLYLNLIEAKVAAFVDEHASGVADQIETLLAVGNDFGTVAKQFDESVFYEETGGLVDSKNIDGGRATEAMGLEVGEQSGKFLSINGDGYYFVKLIDKTESDVNFVSIFVPFSTFNDMFTELQDSGLIRENIELSL